MKRLASVALAVVLTAPAAAKEPAYPGLYPHAPERSAADILAEAYAAAGGESWRRPKTLKLTGYAVMHRGGAATTYDSYEMWRVYDWRKQAAHEADGKVRIQAKKDGKTVLLLIFDGEKTYDLDGEVADATAGRQWASNFGFGAIRHGLDEGWTATRLPDDMMDGKAVYTIELKDPKGGVTRFAIDQASHQLVYAGFDTPRGWHERRYSDYYRKKGVAWAQPRRVRLHYDGVKQNEIIWTNFELDVPMPDELFRPPTKP